MKYQNSIPAGFKICPVISLLLLFNTFCFATDLNYDSLKSKSLLKNTLDKRVFFNIPDSVNNDSDNDKFKILPYIAPSYSPETDVLLSAGGLISFKLQKSNSFLERSSIPFSLGYSTNGSAFANMKFNIYGKNDKLRIIGEYWLKNMPDNYWGVGYDNGRNRDQSDSTTQYRREWISLYQKFLIRMGKKIFAGPILDINRTKAKKLNPLMESDPNIVEDGTSIKNSGIGFVLAYDTRDIGVNAYKGLYLDYSLVLYDKFLCGKSKYIIQTIDYRQYVNVGVARHTLAWQIKGRTGFGEVPWTELSQLGHPAEFRGYTWGRYRDRSMIYGVVEYRNMFNRKKPNKKGSYLSRSGFVLWSGLGSISSDFGKWKNWLPNLGLGYRFELQPRMNIRIDYGIGIESSAFYIGFTEAF